MTCKGQVLSGRLPILYSSSVPSFSKYTFNRWKKASSIFILGFINFGPLQDSSSKAQELPWHNRVLDLGYDCQDAKCSQHLPGAQSWKPEVHRSMNTAEPICVESGHYPWEQNPSQFQKSYSSSYRPTQAGGRSLQCHKRLWHRLCGTGSSESKPKLTSKGKGCSSTLKVYDLIPIYTTPQPTP